MIASSFNFRIQCLYFHVGLQSLSYTRETLQTSAKLLAIYLENYTVWNYWKLAVEHNIRDSESDPDSVKLIFDEELRAVESALRQNCKSYNAWNHQKWVLSKGHSSIDRELKFLGPFQEQASRNFHACNYRRFVAALMNRSTEDEFKYPENLIENDDVDYSAWHNRRNRGSATPFLLEPAQQQTGKFLCSGAPEITQVSESAEHLVQRDRLPPYRHQSLSVHVSSDILRRHEDLPNGVDVENYWAAFMVFKDLDLVQLDVAEIPVANEKLQSFLVRIFPALTWLDGRNLH
ncbi:hypothetical protein CDL15_Pgr013752 [Punica granatum]|uniref:Geranylgeranyl transferase type-2 subunit alpha n=1 Tax=Punica granatum TaxID=22663 RepID=A0A218W1A9_PUNGR|nr:hypothetical protein CDL15_Pgr013752 [Punica granatum]